MAVLFTYAPEILARYPDLVGGVIVAHGLKNGPTPDALRTSYLAEQKAVLERIGTTPLSEIESLACWRRVFRTFGIDPTQYRSAAEALLRRLTKKGDVPSLNMLVDAGNLVSIRYALPVAVFSTHALKGTVTVRFAEGTEHFLPLGEQTIETPEVGEVIFADEEKRVIARRWCWRQSDDSAAREDTTRALITVEAQHPGGRSVVEMALKDLQALLQRFAGGELQAAVLDRDHAAFEGLEW